MMEKMILRIICLKYAGTDTAVKKFGRVPEINEAVLYGEDWKQAEAEATKLKENIRSYKSYFLESWCMNHMLHEEYTNFLKTVEKLRSVRRAELLAGHIENYWSTYAGIGKKNSKKRLL